MSAIQTFQVSEIKTQNVSEKVTHFKVSFFNHRFQTHKCLNFKHFNLHYKARLGNMKNYRILKISRWSHLFGYFFRRM